MRDLLRRHRFPVLLLAPLLLMGAGGDPISPVVFHLAVIIIAAKLGGDLAVRVGQPAVLGELVVGVALGNAMLVGFGGFEPIESDVTVDQLARLGVLILLFEVGLESTVSQMLSVGVTSLAVAVLGVVAPFGLGWLVGIWLLPDASEYVHAFLGATLCATSVGITARVLQDLSRSQSREARVILGAAVIDDVLGLVVLAVVTGVIAAADAGTEVSYGAIGGILIKAFVFLVGAIAIGVALAPRLFTIASKLRARGALLATGLALCFLLSWLADLIGLAPIVGAFAAGLILDEVHYKEFRIRGEHGLEELVHPISGFLVPVFFVLMGMKTDLRSFAQPGVLGLAAALTIAAIIGKQACSLGVFEKGLDKLSIGIGMVPRGEVGLIFANIGLGLTIAGERVISEATYSAVVVMVIGTTMLTPPALKWSLGRRPAS
jgi:Kef-type K+ transport system membrane component KefB